MIRVYVVNGKDRTVEPVDVNEVQDAYKVAGLQATKVDHATVFHDPLYGTLAIVVYEFSLFVPPEEQDYFTIGRNLYGGNGVLYAADRYGETVSMDSPPEIMFYRSFEEVEKVIEMGEVQRPETRVNGKLIWRWPQRKVADV